MYHFYVNLIWMLQFRWCRNSFFFFNLLFSVFRLAFVCLLATVCYVIVRSICCPPLRCILLPYDFRFRCVTVSAPASKKIMHQDWPCDFFWPLNYICMEWPVTHQNRGLENHSVFPPHSCLCYKSGNISGKGHFTLPGPQNKKRNRAAVVCEGRGTRVWKIYYDTFQRFGGCLLLQDIITQGSDNLL